MAENGLPTRRGFSKRKRNDALLRVEMLCVFLSFIILALFPAASVSGAETVRARVIFIGDIMAHKEQLDAARSGDVWNFAPQFRRVKPLFADALVVGNLETVFAGERSRFTGYPTFNTPDELADALADLGVDVVTLAGNHIMDKKPSGAARTVDVLESRKIRWAGLGYGGMGPNEPLIFEYAGLRWAFVNYSYGSNAPISNGGGVSLNVISRESVTKGLAKAREAEPDVIAAFFHWGLEYQFSPTKRQRDIAALSVEGGASLVIGTHPHVLQPAEIVSSDRRYSLTAYSLGNFVSYQRTLPRERSVIMAVDLEKGGDGKTRIVRVSIAPTRVAVTGPPGRRRVEVVYAGRGGSFNHAGLPADELKTARSAGDAVLDFLGAAASSDEMGFYTLWSEDAPDALPKGRRKAPR
jgi:poly-gamma-glutamate synthesis protein (capsule biosynthesis protein)